MLLLIVRHATAVARGTPGIADDERPLTPEGEKKFRKAAQGLARLLGPPDALLTSPLPRARRTAEIAAEAWGTAAPEATAALSQGDFGDLVRLLSERDEGETIAIFGHEPDVSDWLARLLGTPHGERLTFKKGGAALVEIDGHHDRGRLVWFLPPRVLRAVADGE